MSMKNTDDRHRAQPASHKMVWREPDVSWDTSEEPPDRITTFVCDLFRKEFEDELLDSDQWCFIDDGLTTRLGGGPDDLPRKWEVQGDPDDPNYEDRIAIGIYESPEVWEAVEDRLLNRNGLTREHVEVETFG